MWGASGEDEETHVFDDSPAFLVYFTRREVERRAGSGQSVLAVPSGPAPQPIKRWFMRRRGAPVTATDGGKQMLVLVFFPPLYELVCSGTLIFEVFYENLGGSLRTLLTG